MMTWPVTPEIDSIVPLTVDDVVLLKPAEDALRACQDVADGDLVRLPLHMQPGTSSGCSDSSFEMVERRDVAGNERLGHAPLRRDHVAYATSTSPLIGSTRRTR
jgi:hypothetical protein